MVPPVPQPAWTRRPGWIKADLCYWKCTYSTGRLYELIEEKKLDPELIIGVPVGFVNVVQSKELIMHTDVPYIVARGRKGGSNIAACICNALLYMIDNNRG